MTEANRKIVDDNKVKLAMQPKVSLPEEENEVEQVVEGKADLNYTVEVEVLPEITVGDLKAISIERLTVPVTDKQVTRSIPTDTRVRDVQINRDSAALAEFDQR